MAITTEKIESLEDPAQNLEALIRVRAGLDEQDYVTWWIGDAYGEQPDADTQHLFGFVGFNIARAVKVEGGFDLITREAAFYLDPRERTILEEWHNPYTDENVDVLHIYNDPVNQQFRLSMPWGPWHSPYTVMDRSVVFNLDIPISAPSPLPVAEFPANSADDTYRAMELFQFFADREELLNTDAPSVHCDVSWMRRSPWLPWMQMGQRPGGMVFHCRGSKLASFDDLPDGVREYIDAHTPEYRESPREYVTPNETSWSYFRKVALGETKYPVSR